MLVQYTSDSLTKTLKHEPLADMESWPLRWLFGRKRKLSKIKWYNITLWIYGNTPTTRTRCWDVWCKGRDVTNPFSIINGGDVFQIQYKSTQIVHESLQRGLFRLENQKKKKSLYSNYWIKYLSKEGKENKTIIILFQRRFRLWVSSSLLVALWHNINIPENYEQPDIFVTLYHIELDAVWFQ